MEHEAIKAPPGIAEERRGVDLARVQSERRGLGLSRSGLGCVLEGQSLRLGAGVGLAESGWCGQEVQV